MQSAAILLEDKNKTKLASPWEKQRPPKKKKKKERKKAFARVGYRSPLSVAAAGLLPQAEAQLPAGLGGFEFALIVPLL